ncbi:outer membrane lipoprotein-sorting protein [Yeosuana marina]|uniref:outer membrane lipoprotein-sorting protein n=1 Tax=Yeosuana marina TaxID=1565536 RepID=UPI001423F273|nr:outer membrane lipoprotein-sorting protein [Yeosuana marina]
MKTNKLIKPILYAFCALLSISSFAQTISAREIMQTVIDRPDGNNRKAKLTMELINKRGSKRLRSVLIYSMDIDKDKKNLMYFLSPADVEGTAFLTWEYDDSNKEDDRWLFLPALNKTRRISGTSAKKDYFMGTDFTYEDMGTRNIDENTYKLLENQTSNDNLWVIESTPTDPRDIYSKLVSYIDKTQLIAHKIEFYDKMGNLMKTLIVTDINKVDGFWIAHKMHMVNHQQNHETILSITDVTYNISINENMFTVSKMEKGIVN